MYVDGKAYRTIWLPNQISETIHIIDQRHLPFRFVEEELKTVEDTARAIKEMHVRGAGCIGATAGFGMYLATVEASRYVDFEKALRISANILLETRPTAVNLSWAIKRQLRDINNVDDIRAKIEVARLTGQAIADEDVIACQQIGQHGLPLIRNILAEKVRGPVNILTHCNAGWLAFVDHGSATAPIYAAHNAGLPLHVWVDETRPRNQGARLTAWELAQQGVPHTVITDNAGGHLMQNGQVDMVITGTDRTTRTGDVANKIGTYLKALAARDNKIPFYVALPSSTFDWNIRDGAQEIPIETRDAMEVTHISGELNGEECTVKLLSKESKVANHAFDVTPARLVTGLITERGACDASESGILTLFPEKKYSLRQYRFRRDLTADEEEQLK
jgi:methylthioribose-1-phosphate isomerase